MGAQAEENANLKEIMPVAARFEAVKQGEEILYYKAKDNQNKKKRMPDIPMQVDVFFL